MENVINSSNGRISAVSSRLFPRAAFNRRPIVGLRPFMCSQTPRWPLVEQSPCHCAWRFNFEWRRTNLAAQPWTHGRAIPRGQTVQVAGGTAGAVGYVERVDDESVFSVGTWFRAKTAYG